MIRMFCDACGKEIKGRFYEVRLVTRDTEERGCTTYLTTDSIAVTNAINVGGRLIPNVTGYCPECAAPAIRLVEGDRA